MPCSCPSPAQCTCRSPDGSAAKSAALAICQSIALPCDAASAGVVDKAARAQCPFTGLTLSQIAELKQAPPEQLQRSWRGIAQRLT